MDAAADRGGSDTATRSGAVCSRAPSGSSNRSVTLRYAGYCHAMQSHFLAERRQIERPVDQQQHRARSRRCAPDAMPAARSPGRSRPGTASVSSEITARCKFNPARAHSLSRLSCSRRSGGLRRRACRMATKSEQSVEIEMRERARVGAETQVALHQQRLRTQAESRRRPTPQESRWARWPDRSK